ncbi:AbfB domain-containing protein [Streptomyces phaeochromogenes]|uniref:AbfB domain-containing protein n=1 Tax=Streptomyces phaeochromogenes TaxID=1923 RepID=A0ABZ1HJ47_STRPH|nr:AbfB domain-containing protein [Streptomyces phaeochromogenes]WSD18642.1 AbfB domain-containing protein [Streptomyces phaeochromogenes]
MPERTPGSAPDPSARPTKVWETGETVDESRVPGTRRLWLAGALLVAVLASTVTAVVVLDDDPDTSAKGKTKNTTSSADEPLIPSPPPATAPSGKSGLTAPDSSKPVTDGSASPEAQQQGGSKPDSTPRPSKSASAKPPASKPKSSKKSVQAVNYPDRYWHIERDSVRLDRVGSHSSSQTRDEASFKVVPGIADSSCVSFSLGNNRYLRHYQFRLRADSHNGSELFKQDATFCPRPTGFNDAVMLESYNYRGRFLRHRDFQVRLEPFDNNHQYRADSAFRLVKGLG